MVFGDFHLLLVKNDLFQGAEFAGGPEFGGGMRECVRCVVSVCEVGGGRRGRGRGRR